MSEMVKNVAQAIAHADSYGGLEHAHERTLLHYSTLARAAIEAMREPTEEMIAACDINIPTEGMIIGVWTDMIDAALDKVDA
jgi:hypothetical protein